eukprot:9486241-Pyramimonas_sp.AAC.2
MYPNVNVSGRCYVAMLLAILPCCFEARLFFKLWKSVGLLDCWTDWSSIGRKKRENARERVPRRNLDPGGYWVIITFSGYISAYFMHDPHIPQHLSMTSTYGVSKWSVGYQCDAYRMHWRSRASAGTNGVRQMIQHLCRC